MRTRIIFLLGLTACGGAPFSSDTPDAPNAPDAIGFDALSPATDTVDAASTIDAQLDAGDPQLDAGAGPEEASTDAGLIEAAPLCPIGDVCGPIQTPCDLGPHYCMTSQFGLHDCAPLPAACAGSCPATCDCVLDGGLPEGSAKYESCAENGGTVVVTVQ